MSDPRPIGVFDSGIGGLTVLREIRRALPGESLLYLGDTARVPYGAKSKDTVLRYSLNNMRFLNHHGVKMIVVACNTASAYALPELAASETKPVIGVVEGGVEAAVAVTRGDVGIIGTEATINSRAYPIAIEKRLPECRIHSAACPLFVPLVEEGWTGNAIAKAVAAEYLGRFRGVVDTLVLGCTHYPLLKPVIAGTVGPEVTLIDSAEQTAIVVKRTLEQRGLISGETEGEIRIVVTDSPQRNLNIGRRMLGEIEVDHVDLADFSEP